MNGKDSIGEFLINQYPYKVHQVRSQTGELVWVQAGVNPDNVFQDKRRSDWPYSEITADLICQQIVEGASLTCPIPRSLTGFKGGKSHVSGPALGEVNPT